jgi:P4 family phage/plasmid primase-like protien
VSTPVPPGTAQQDQASLNGHGKADPCRAVVWKMLRDGHSDPAIAAELDRMHPGYDFEVIRKWVADVITELKIPPDPAEMTPEQRELIRQLIEAEHSEWKQRFALKSAGDPIGPWALLRPDKHGRIDMWQTAEFMLPRSDQLSGTRLADLSGHLLHYGSQYKEWLAWDDDQHIHTADATDAAGSYVQRYAIAHAEALRLIQAQVEQQARVVTQNLRLRKSEAETALLKARQDPEVNPWDLDKLAKASAIMAVAFGEAWAEEMAVYGIFKRHRAYRDSLWGKKTKNDVAGELKTMLATDMGTFDAHPEWLVCDNGVIEVRETPKGPRFPLLWHSPERLVTKRLGRGVVADWSATCPAWEKFLASTVKDPADRLFIQRRVGAALAGRRVKDFLNMIGKPDTGKTTFNLVMKALFGSYFASPDVSVFMAGSDPMPWDLDLCRGARYVYAAEPEPRSRFRDGMVKKLTGGDPVESARKYGHPVTWEPQCMLVFATNHPIWFDTSDAAMFGRAKPVEFSYAGPKDPHLMARLLAELPGIFTWGLHGLHGYMTEGIPAVTPAMAKLRERIAAESDPALRFLAMAIEQGYLAQNRTAVASACVGRNELYPKFEAWCELERVRDVAGKQKFNERVGRIYPLAKSDGWPRFSGLLPGARYREVTWWER